MKHTLYATTALVLLFLASHLIGLFLVFLANPVEARTLSDGSVQDVHETVSPPGLEIPGPMEHPYLPITIGILLGTGLALLMIRFRTFRLMRYWHLFGISLCLYVALFYVFAWLFESLVSPGVLLLCTLVLAVGLALLRTYRSSPWVHNITELFIYGGIAVLFSSLFKTEDLGGASVAYASVLLILISLYDAYAVWRSKHMIRLATTQAEQRLFAGLQIPYRRRTASSSGGLLRKEKTTLAPRQKVLASDAEKTAVLGGGDIAFTLLYSAVVLLATFSLAKAVVVSVCAGISLFLLLFFAKKDTFYPAMPFLSLGCFSGVGIIMLF